MHGRPDLVEPVVVVRGPSAAAGGVGLAGAAGAGVARRLPPDGGVGRRLDDVVARRGAARRLGCWAWRMAASRSDRVVIASPPELQSAAAAARPGVTVVGDARTARSDAAGELGGQAADRAADRRARAGWT